MTSVSPIAVIFQPRPSLSEKRNYEQSLLKVGIETSSSPSYSLLLIASVRLCLQLAYIFMYCCTKIVGRN